MASTNMYSLLKTMLDDTPQTEMSDDLIQRLRHFIPDNLILAAADLVDRDRVIRFNTPWDRHLYEVIGSSTNYSVFPSIQKGACYCTCPSFAFAVLAHEDVILCKHVLAVLIAQRLSRCIIRHIKDEDLLRVLLPHFGADDI